MSEYQFVEKPFLDQLAALGWHVIDQGPLFPTDPTKSLRTSFREINLRGVFKESVRSINLTEDGHPWLTDKQLDELYDQLCHFPAKSLNEANESVLSLLFRAQVDLNELTGEEYPNVHLIDFKHPERNHFIAINQFRIDTPGRVKDCIIPDIVLFVNGIPLAVIECKDANQIQANPMHEAFKQLMRYSDQRPETKVSGLKEGDPLLFYPNQVLIRTCGDQADFGSITSTDEAYFFPWRDIWPEKYKNYEPPLGKEREQEILIQGMLPPETFLDIIRTCTVFMDIGKTRVKVVSRYQQYRAMSKIIQRLRSGKTPIERSGVIWHTQGSGKSLTMVFAIRKIRACDDLKDFKVCLINDRKDLEKQLGSTATLTGEKPTFIDSSEKLRKNFLLIPWLTDKQLDELYDQLRHFPAKSLIEANESVLSLLFRTQVDLNELTGEEYPNVHLIDFKNPERNHFIAINQFRIDTPGRVKDCIIPDIVLFVNGIPLAVIECKDANQIQANPMHEAFKQLMRYSNQRPETKVSGLKEGDPLLFYPNQVLIRTCGDQADFGSITSTDEAYFFPWRDIWPEKYQNYVPPLGKEREQEILIQGMLPPETFLDIIRTCTVFMDIGKTRVKVVSRYQQYRAMSKIIQRLRSGKTPI